MNRKLIVHADIADCHTTAIIVREADENIGGAKRMDNRFDERKPYSIV
jgi:hypothetical protein